MLEGLQELCADSAIDRAMIDRKCHFHDGRDTEIAVLGDHPLFTRADRQNASLRRVDDSREIFLYSCHST